MSSEHGAVPSRFTRHADDCRSAAPYRGIPDRADARSAARGRIRIAELRYRAGRGRRSPKWRAAGSRSAMCAAPRTRTYLVQAFGDELLMQLQLNVHRLVVVYRVPALDALDASSLVGASRTLAPRGRACRLEIRLARRPDLPGEGGRRWVETYCYAFAAPDLLENEPGTALLAHRHRPDDALLHARGGPLRRAPVAAPRRFPGLIRYGWRTRFSRPERVRQDRETPSAARRAASDRPPRCGRSAPAETEAGSPVRVRDADSRTARR